MGTLERVVSYPLTLVEWVRFLQRVKAFVTHLTRDWFVRWLASESRLRISVRWCEDALPRRAQ